MRNNIIGLFYFIGFALSINATMPMPEPIEEVFERFASTYIRQCEELMKELPVNYPEKERDFKYLSEYLRNIKQDNIPGVRRTINAKSKDAFDFPYWLRQLTGNIIGFRRVLDELIIINLANNSLILSEELQKKLKKNWEDERFYSLRFEHEAYLIDMNAKLIATSDPKGPLRWREPPTQELGDNGAGPKGAGEESQKGARGKP